MIENTRMSKSYKMPFLLAFYNNGDLKSIVDDEDLYKSFKEFYSIKENTVDMYADKNTEKFAQWGREKYVELAKKKRKKKKKKKKKKKGGRQNPVKYMLKSESEFFELDRDKIVVRRLEEFKNRRKKNRKKKKKRNKKKKKKKKKNKFFVDEKNTYI